MNENGGKIYTAIPAIMAEIGAISKGRKNVQQGYGYRGIDDFYNAIHPLMAKYHVFSVPEVLSEKREERTSKGGSALIYTVLSVKYTFYADDGSNFITVVTGEGMDSGDKSANKALSVAHKYALAQIFCVPTEDMTDPEIESHVVMQKSTASDADTTLLAQQLRREMDAAKNIIGEEAWLKTDSLMAKHQDDPTWFIDQLARLRAKVAEPKKDPVTEAMTKLQAAAVKSERVAPAEVKQKELV